MPGLGGYNPSPQQYGAASGTSLEAIQDAISRAVGGGLTNDRGTVLWAENHALARVLWALYTDTERLANQWDPYRMTDYLPRWEAIYGIQPPYGATMGERRSAVQLRRALIGRGTAMPALHDFLVQTLGDVYDHIEYTVGPDVVRYCPGGGSIPLGPTLGDGDTLPSDVSPYYTRVGAITIVVVQPPNTTEDQMYMRISRMYPTVSSLVAGWVSWDWVRLSPQGPGFWLDEDHNLDNQPFDD